MIYKYSLIICSVFLLVNIEPSWGYNEKTTHIKINESVVKYDTFLESFLKDKLGFNQGKQNKIKGEEIRWWLEKGGEWEDATFPWSGPNYRYLRHFQDPLSIWENGGLNNYDSLIYWAIKTEENPLPQNNPYSWTMARKFFFNSLVEDDSDNNFAELFRALGQLMHLMSDAAVPAHVRNDAHPGMGIQCIDPRLAGDMFENWAMINYKNTSLINYTGKSIDPAIFSKADLSQAPKNPITALWDQNVWTGSNPSMTWASDLGLAEFTNANFISQDTAFGFYPHPDLINTQVTVLEQKVGEDGKIDNVYYILHTEKNYHLATVSFIDCYDLSTRGFGQDDVVWQDYAAQLIPRAVGYSTALLNYFFRGSIEISAPDGFVYSIIDGAISPHQFNHVKAKLRNTTAGEEMLAGKLVAVAKYKKRTDYREDLSTDPPVESSRNSEFSYSVSVPVEIASLSSNQAEEYIFDFSADPIPAGVTDLFLQVVFKGTLGKEEDIAVAVGMKDLNEPSHHVIWNSTDQLVCRNALYTSGEVRVFFGALADLDGDGVFNEVNEGEPYIDPYAVTKDLTFTKEEPTTASEPLIVSATVSQLPPGRYSRVIMLADIPDSESAWITISSTRPWNQAAASSYYSFTNVTAQDSLGLPWAPTPLFPQDYVHRGVKQHHVSMEFYCLEPGWSCSYLGDQRPIPSNKSPYPVQIYFP